MRMGRGEAIDIFRKWFAEETLIYWKGRFAKFGFVSFGRVISVNDNELRLMADDRKSELVVHFDDDLEFGYADSRVGPPEEQQYGDFIMVCFSSPEEEEPDFISLAAADPQFKAD